MFPVERFIVRLNGDQDRYMIHVDPLGEVTYTKDKDKALDYSNEWTARKAMKYASMRFTVEPIIKMVEDA